MLDPSRSDKDFVENKVWQFKDQDALIGYIAEVLKESRELVEGK